MSSSGCQFKCVRETFTRQGVKSWNSEMMTDWWLGFGQPHRRNVTEYSVNNNHKSMFHRQEKTALSALLKMTGSKTWVYSTGQKLNSVRRQYKAKKGLLFMYFLVMKWMKNEVSLVLRHSLAWASRLSSDSSKLLLSFCFLRIWLQILLRLKKT